MQCTRKRLITQFNTDHLLANTKSLEGNPVAWICTTVKFTVSYTCTNSSEVGDTQHWLNDDVGILDRLKSDLAPEIMGKHTKFQDQVKRLQTDTFKS